MQRKNSILNFLFKFILAFLMSFAFVLALCSSLWSSFAHTYTAFDLLSTIFVCMLVLSLVLLNKVLVKITSFMVILASIFFLVYSLLNSKFNKFFNEFNHLLLWIYRFANEKASLDTTYEKIVMTLLCAAITLFIFIFTIRRFNFFVVLIAGAAIFVTQEILGYIIGYSSFYLFIFLILIYYMLHVYYKNAAKESNDYTSPALFAFWVIPVCAIVFLSSFLIPSKSKPLEWEWMDKKVNAFFDSMQGTPKSEVFDYFSLTSTGFGNSSKLGGRVKLDDTLVLTVNAPSPMYLKGSCKDTYTGGEWLISSTSTNVGPTPFEEAKSKLGFDYNEALQGLKYLMGNDFSSYYRSTDHFRFFNNERVEITYEEMKTKSLFYPIKLQYPIIINYGTEVVVDENGSLLANNYLKKNYNYSVALFDIKNTDELHDLLRKSKKGIYRDALNGWRRIQQIEDLHVIINGETVDAFSAGSDVIIYGEDGDEGLKINSSSALVVHPELDELVAQSDAVYGKYLQLPETLPERVKELAESITSKYNNNYDKAKALEQHLSANYKYTLDPGSVPKGRDFVDYFLFDSKEGYCVYYATAMTILARSIGIPARYVEGYVMPSKPKQGSTYKITNEQAHAWVEVYFEGFGWMPFEPTAFFGSALYGNMDSDQQDNWNAVDSMTMEYLKRIRGESGEEAPEPSGGSDMEGDEDEQKTTGSFFIFLMIGIFVALLLVTLLSIITVNHFRFKKKMHHRMGMQSTLPAKDIVLHLYTYYMNLIKLQGLRIGPGETPKQYAQRVDTYLHLAPIKFRTVTDIFILARYSQETIYEKDAKTVYLFMNQLLANTKERLGKVKFFIYKYLLGKM